MMWPARFLARRKTNEQTIKIWIMFEASEDHEGTASVEEGIITVLKESYRN